MSLFSETKILPYKPIDLFRLVLDVESYPEFLPWCAASRIISNNDNEIIAELVLKVKGFIEKYQSHITYIYEDEKYLINVEAISGPFKYLRNIWQFSHYKECTKLEFKIDFKMKSTLLEKLIASYFARATEKIIIAFEKRAEIMLQK